MGGAEPPVLRVELIWDAGRPHEHHRLQAGATLDMMLEGTTSRSAAELEAHFEYYGTSLTTPDLLDTGNLSVSTILKHAPALLPAMAEVAAAPAFTEASFRRFLKRRRQRLREGLSDNDTLAYRMLTEAVFGADHPYGYNGYPADYDALRLEDLRAFHRSHFHAGNATLFVAGRLNDELDELLDATFGQLPTGPGAPTPTLHPPPGPPRLLQLRRPRAQQTLIRRGRRGIDIGSEDYGGLVVLETIFGGYFSSRLMRNIREEKGYTYGIESDIDTFRYDGSFGVAADVANENLDNVRREIGVEIDKLLQHPVPTKELDMVRAYLAGSLAMELDGTFGHGYRHRSAIIKGYDPALLLRRLDEAVRHVTPAELQDLAHKYLDPAGDTEVILGGAELLPEAEAITHTDRPVIG